MKTQQTHELAGCCAMGLCGPGRAQEVRDQEALRKLTPSKIQKIIKQIHAGDKPVQAHMKTQQTDYEKAPEPTLSGLALLEANKRRHTPAQAHSPLPWWAVGTGILQGDANDPQVVATTETGDIMNVEASEECEANAAFIVHACNNVERLAEALKWIQDFSLVPEGTDTPQAKVLAPVHKIAREAIAQWEGGKQ